MNLAPKKLAVNWPMTDAARELAQTEAEDFKAELDDGLKTLFPNVKDN